MSPYLASNVKPVIVRSPARALRPPSAESCHAYLVLRYGIRKVCRVVCRSGTLECLGSSRRTQCRFGRQAEHPAVEMSLPSEAGQRVDVKVECKCSPLRQRKAYYKLAISSSGS